MKRIRYVHNKLSSLTAILLFLRGYFVTLPSGFSISDAGTCVEIRWKISSTRIDELVEVGIGREIVTISHKLIK